MPDEGGLPPDTADASALAELASCETLSQVSAWTARRVGRAAGADAALLWTPDPAHPVLLSTGAWGESVRAFSRRSLGRDDPLVREPLRDRRPRLLSPAEMAASGSSTGLDLPAPLWGVLLPVFAENVPVALGMLLFGSKPPLEAVLDRVAPVLRLAAPAFERAVRAERKNAGMRQAIERLTSLYDVSKAFGSTIEWSELTGIVARKAVDFANAEAGSLWLLEKDGESVVLAATSVNENYDVSNPPDAVGSALVGDVLAEGGSLRRNGIPPDDPSNADSAEYPIRSVLAVALIEDERPIGALVVVNKRGRASAFTEEDEELLHDLSRQAVRALRNARQYEAERRVEELDALLAVSREITATLDLDKVMQAIVNATSALVEYDRCAIAIQDRGRLRLGAVSGMAEIDRGSPEIRRTEDLLQWVFLSGEDVDVTESPDGSIASARPETEEKFRAFFAERGVKAFFAVILEDEEGKLGVLAFESAVPIASDPETRDLLQILVNQATVAVRNAQLYQQVPLPGFLKPLLDRSRTSGGASRRRLLSRLATAAILILLLLVVPWRLRIGGAARVGAGRRSVVAAGVDGVIAAVRRREGDSVAAGEEIASIEDGKYVAALAEARSGYQIAEAEVARSRADGNAAATAEAESRRTEFAAKVISEETHLAHARLVAPAAGVIVTPHLEDRVGQYFARGTELCVVADVSRVVVEVAVPEGDASLLRVSEPADLKINSYPTRIFHGTVSRVGARLRDDGKERFLVAEVAVDNSGGALKMGMLGKGKIVAGRRSIAILLLRKPARWIYQKVWPLLP